MRALLRHRDFRLYLTGQAISGLGSALSTIALVFAVLAISPSAQSVGLVLLASRLPGVVLTLGGGVVADRWPRRRVALCVDLIRTVLQCGTGLLIISGAASVPLLAALQCGAGAASAVFNPAASALVVTVAPGGELRRANSVLGIATAVAQTAGFALAGVIVAVLGPGTSFIVDAGTFAFSSLTLWLITAGASDTAARAIAADGAVAVAPSARPLVSQLGDGWRAVTSRPWLRICALHETVINVLVVAPFFVLGPVIAKEHLGGAAAWSLIALGYVIGNLTAAHVTFRWAPRQPVCAAIAVSTGIVPLLVLLATPAPTVVIAIAAILAGAQATVYNTLLGTALQANVPAHVLGRAMSVVSVGSTVLVPVSMGVVGVIASMVGPGTVLIAGAGAVIVIAISCGLMPSARVELALDLDETPTRPR